jgi:hypothetical protein
MNLTVAELGVLLLVLFGLFHYLRILTQTRAILAFFGAVAVGLTGTVGRIAGAIAGWAQHVAGNLGHWAFGVSASFILFVILVVILVHDLHPKKSASARTGWVALTVGILLVAGVSQIPALAPLVGAIRSLLAELTSFVNTL